jgi:drug/metabolite transporter (DMT)-like permease
MIKRNFWKAHLALFVVNALYGAGHIIAKGVMPKYLSPTTFIAFRIAGAMIIFWIIKLFLPKERIDKKDIPRFILCSLFGITINQLFFFHGLSLSSSINSGIIMTTNPLLVVIVGYFLVQEKIGLTKLFGIGIGASGAILLTVTGKTTAGESSLGDIYLFLNAISYAIYLVLAKPLMKKYSPFTTITYFFTFGFVLVLLYPPTIVETMNVSLSAIPTEIWAKIVYIVVGVTFFTYLLTMYGLKFLSPSTSSSYIYFQPVLVILFTYIFVYTGLSEVELQTITWQKVGYMCVIFVGVWITANSKKAENYVRKLR